MRDYAKKDRRRRSTRHARRVTWPMTLTIGLVVIAAVGIYRSYQNTTKHLAARAIQAPTRSAALPTPTVSHTAKSEYAFYRLLPKMTVHVPDPNAIPIDAVDPYRLRFAEVRSESRAHALQNHLAGKGVIANILSVGGGDALRYQLVSPVYVDRWEASQSRARYRRIGVDSILVKLNKR